MPNLFNIMTPSVTTLIHEAYRNDPGPVALSTRMWVDVLNVQDNLRANRTLAGLKVRQGCVWGGGGHSAARWCGGEKRRDGGRGRGGAPFNAAPHATPPKTQNTHSTTASSCGASLSRTSSRATAA